MAGNMTGKCIESKPISHKAKLPARLALSRPTARDFAPDMKIFIPCSSSRFAPSVLSIADKNGDDKP
jgi:hypothetical protein